MRISVNDCGLWINLVSDSEFRSTAKIDVKYGQAFDRWLWHNEAFLLNYTYSTDTMVKVLESFN